MSAYIHPTAVVDEGAKIGEGTKVWLTVLPQPETEKRKEDDDVPGASGGG